MGNYYIPINYLVTNITKTKVLIPPKITKKTIELGSKYSPDYVCVPFKYNLGNFLEALEQGANIILQAGGGCRYGYYAELQEQILKDLNYHFQFVNFIENNHFSLKKIYHFAKKLNPKLNIFTFLYYILNTGIMIVAMDKLSVYPRKNMGFEVEKNSFLKTEASFHKDLSNLNQNPIKLLKTYFHYKKIFTHLKVNKPKDFLKGVLG